MKTTSPTRRRVLALATTAGATALTGCSTVFGSDTVDLDGSSVAAVAAGETPSVILPLPVDGLESHAAGSRERVEKMLDTVPAELSAEEGLDAAAREWLRETVTEAREALSRADDAVGLRERLHRLREARKSARSVAAAWAYANGDHSPEAVRDAARQLREAVRQFQSDRAYVGSDPVRALLVHAVVESWVRSARRRATLDRERGTETGTSDAGTAVRSQTPLADIGRRAGDVERGRASLADARAVDERFTASLSEPRSLRSTFERAQDSLASTVESRMRSLPGEADTATAPADTVLEETTLDVLHGELPFDGATAPDEGLATDLVRQFESLTVVGGFETLRTRIEDGETFAVESVEDLRTRRSAAVTAVRNAVAGSGDRRLARECLGGLPGWVSHADGELERYGDDGTVEANSVSSDVWLYLGAEVVADATPAACTTVLDALGA